MTSNGEGGGYQKVANKKDLQGDNPLLVDAS
jgi:hypothetical protein